MLVLGILSIDEDIPGLTEFKLKKLIEYLQFPLQINVIIVIDCLQFAWISINVVVVYRHSSFTSML